MTMFRLNNKKPSASQLDNQPITTVLGSEIIFSGDIQGTQSIKIDGRVNGNISVENGIILGEKAVVEGDLHSKNIIIYGEIHGNIYCNEIILKSSGTINGDINTNSIEIEMGGKYNGKLKMNQQISSKKEEKV